MAQKTMPRSLRTGIWCRSNHALFAEKKIYPSLWRLSLKTLKDTMSWTKSGRRYRPKRRRSRRLSKKNRLISFQRYTLYSTYGLTVSPFFYEYKTWGSQWQYNPLAPRRIYTKNKRKKILSLIG